MDQIYKYAFTLFAIYVSYIVLKLIRTISITKKKMLTYKKQFQEKGYRVKFYDFQFLAVKLNDKLKESQIKYGNPFQHIIHQFPSYDVIISNGLNQPSIALIHPQLLKQFFNKFSNYQKHHDILSNVERLMAGGIAMSQGDSWKKKRRILSKVFHFQMFESLSDELVKITNETFNIFQGSSKNIWIFQVFKKISAKAVYLIFTGKDIDIQVFGESLELFLQKTFNMLVQQSNNPLGLIFGPRYFELGITAFDRQINRNIKAYNQKMQKIVLQKIEELVQCQKKGIKLQEKKNLISDMYYTKNLTKQTNLDQAYSYKQFAIEFGGFIFAGTDTTGNFMVSMIIQLNNRPEILKKLRQQIKQNIKKKSDLNIEKLRGMKYLNAVINETFRMNPVAETLIMRRVSEPTTIKDIPITVNTIMQVQIGSSGFKQQYFYKPYEFIPERWLQKSNEINSYASLPFSSGARNCIGQHLAMIQIRLMIVIFISRFDFQIRGDIKKICGFIHSPLPFETIITNRSDQMSKIIS